MADVEETITQRHKREQKELQAKLQSLKHSVPKGDKKRKKQVTIEVAQLQTELDQRHEQELSNEPPQDDTVENEDKGLCNATDDMKLNSEDDDEKEGEIAQVAQKKQSKAQKRREKKEQEERDRQKRLAAGEKESENHARNIEAIQFNKILKEHNLKIHEVQPDGNCMYNSIIVHKFGCSKEESLRDLRERTSQYMRSHQDEFLPFTSNQKTGDMLNQEEYTKYCDEIQHTNCWGGHLELRAISHFYNERVEVFQATAPAIIIGEEYKGDPIRISYHRYQYGLGEHYNALVPND